MLSQLITTEQWPVNWLLLKEITIKAMPNRNKLFVQTFEVYERRIKEEGRCCF